MASSGKINISMLYWCANFPDPDFKQDWVLMKHIKKMIPTLIFAEDMEGCRRAELGTIHLQSQISIHADEIKTVDRGKWVDRGGLKVWQKDKKK